MNAPASEVPEVLLLGEPQLRGPCAAVQLTDDPDLGAEMDLLHARLALFRQEHGFGRGISAPQIGIAKRFIAMNLDGELWTLLNPEIVWRSEERFRMWDDCMSFPDLLVRVRRNRSISVRFTTPDGRKHLWESVDLALSELLQHEIDHLDGILAVDRADGPGAIVSRAEFDQRKTELEAGL